MPQNPLSDETNAASAPKNSAEIRREPPQMPVGDSAEPPRKSGFMAEILWSMLGIFLFCGFCALGAWQIKRLGWKEDLIARANARIHLAAIAAPPKADWPKLSAAQDEYRPVYIKGHFLHDKEILVKASVLLNALDESGGAGYWVLTPLQDSQGALTFINRGFVPLDKKAQAERAASLPQSEVEIHGLLRMSEGAGYLFNKNDPKNHIWYNRQLPAFAAADALPPQNVAPYFIDADKTPNPGGWPRGGLTVVQFPNNHLVYALTWFSGALGVVFAAALIIRSRRRENRR